MQLGRWKTLFLSLTGVLAAAGASHAASTQKAKIGGSGPIDRPTNHTSAWCFSEWTFCPTDLDSFIADGDSATVVVRARNWKTGNPGLPIDFHLDNVAVVTRTAYDAHLASLAGSPDYSCNLPQTGTDALDLASLNPADVAYYSDFDGAIGPEWSFDPLQVSYETVGSNNSDPMYDDPFDPMPSTTGNMRIGSGAGDEFVEATLQLSGLKRGTEYVLCYWSASSNDLVGFSCSPGESYDDYELSVYGEQDVCLPDVPAISAADVRTLAWDSRSGIWRFQVKFESDGVGEASNIMATLATVPTDVVVLQAEAPIPDLGTGPPDTEAWAGASFVVDLSAYTLSAMFVGVEFGFENDCGRGSSSQTSFLLGAPGSYPVATPSAIEPVLGQNYPNPFNPQTILPLRMPTSGHASLRIYDVQGRLVRVLHEGMLAAGEHSMRWGGEDDRGRGVGAGVYLARFRAGPAAQVRRLVLIE